MSASGPPRSHWDRGLQPERTALAWRRTALALCAGLILAARATASQAPWLALELTALAVLGGLALVHWAHRRERRLALHLRSRRPAPPGGRLLLTTCCLTAGLGLVAAAWVIAAGA
ncbi:DUF202 domain-containing protein [Glycomyces terrestris]|uniref:DUF202 domain-containing protein n=1 Tax=Glycomyces terrestris TaxID=2493553 RepID=A0A426UVX0_9ACTN|nr:DUF202 domain-containing protein [Glycomyces terrestris]RRR98477.1 DUF202 domain-containing protein [Glycomyces terrestris]